MSAHSHSNIHSIPTGDFTVEEVRNMALGIVHSLDWKAEVTVAGKIHGETDAGNHFILHIDNGHLTFSENDLHPSVEGQRTVNDDFILFQHLFVTMMAEVKAHQEESIAPTPDGPLDSAMSEELDKANDGSLWRLLIPNKGFFVTPLVSDICILVFIVMCIMGAGFFDPSSESLVKWGGNYSPLTLGGQWWRLITAVFVHVGVLHLLLNLFGLIFVAVFVEPILGAWRFLVAYLVTGVLASVASLWWHTVILSAGASGAIMGIYGLFMALLASDLINKDFRKGGLIYFGVIIAFNLFSGIKEGIDNAAHVGGLVSGFAIGYMYYPSLKKPDVLWLKIVSPIVVLILGSGITYYAMKHIPNYIEMYDNAMSQVDRNAKQALQIFKMPEGTTHQQMLTQIDSQGIQLWQQNIKLMDELDKIPKLPEPLKDDIDNERVYSTLRKKDFELEYKRVNENTERYDDSLKLLEHQIDSVVHKMNAADSVAKKGD